MSSGVAEKVGAYALKRVTRPEVVFSFMERMTEAFSAVAANFDFVTQTNANSKANTIDSVVFSWSTLPKECVVLLTKHSAVCQSSFLECSYVHSESQ